MSNQSAQLKAEYMKQRKRVQSLVSRAKKQGFTVPDNFVPAIPKRITQGSINRLAKLTPQNLYTKSTIEVPTTDKQGNATVKTITAATYKAQNKKNKARKKNSKSPSSSATNTPKKKQVKATEKRQDKPKDKTKETERKPTIEERYAEVQEAIDRNTIPDWLTDDLAQTYGYDTARDMWDDSWENEYTNKTIQVLENAFAGQAKKAPTGYTISDDEYIASYEPLDNSDDTNFQEDTMVLNRVKDLVDHYSETLGGNILNNILSSSIKNYGEENVAGALSAMEEQNPKLLAELQNIIFYPQHGSDSGKAGRAFKALADAIKMYDSTDRGAFDKALGDAMDALQYYDNIR